MCAGFSDPGDVAHEEVLAVEPLCGAVSRANRGGEAPSPWWPKFWASGSALLGASAEINHAKPDETILNYPTICDQEVGVSLHVVVYGGG